MTFNQLLNELDKFRDSETFIRFGFSEASPHRQWFEQMLEEKAAGCLPAADILTLGVKYALRSPDVQEVRNHFMERWRDE